MTFFEAITIVSLVIGPMPVFAILVWVGRQAQRIDRAELDIETARVRFHDLRNQLTSTLADLQLKVERLVVMAEEARKADH